MQCTNPLTFFKLGPSDVVQTSSVAKVGGGCEPDIPSKLVTNEDLLHGHLVLQTPGVGQDTRVHPLPLLVVIRYVQGKTFRSPERDTIKR